MAEAAVGGSGQDGTRVSQFTEGGLPSVASGAMAEGGGAVRRPAWEPAAGV